MTSNTPHSESTPSIEHEEENLHQKINRETARIRWSELATFFASGDIVTVSEDIDLIEAAIAMSEDNSQQVQEWMHAGLLMQTSDQQAIEWQTDNKELWAVVIKPWILVQSST